MKHLSYPSRIVLELTPLCNLSCSMCPRHYVDAKDGYMSTQLFQKLCKEIAGEDKKSIVLPFWRGESCLHPDFKELMNFALELGLSLHLSTNGHFLDDEIADIFYRLEFLTFSLHTDLGFKNAQKFVSQKPKWSNVTTQVSFVDSEKSVEKYLQKVVADEKLYGFDSVRLYKEHTVGGEFGKSADMLSRNRNFCPKLMNSFVVAYDGSFSRCNHIWMTEKHSNLNNASIKETWESDRMNEIRQSYPDKDCTPCDQWSGHTNGEAWLMNDGILKHIKYGTHS